MLLDQDTAAPLAAALKSFDLKAFVVGQRPYFQDHYRRDAVYGA